MALDGRAGTAGSGYIIAASTIQIFRTYGRATWTVAFSSLTRQHRHASAKAWDRAGRVQHMYSLYHGSRGICFRLMNPDGPIASASQTTSSFTLGPRLSSFDQRGPRV